MNLYIQQSIQIQFIKIGSVSNSSVLQIGSAGVIRPASNLFNTGGFIKPAPQADKPGSPSGTQVPGNSGTGTTIEAPAVPFSIS
jgi:spore germination protein PB